MKIYEIDLFTTVASIKIIRKYFKINPLKSQEELYFNKKFWKIGEFKKLEKKKFSK